MTDSAGPMQVDTKLVRELAELLDTTRLTEIEVQDGDRKIRVARTPRPSPPHRCTRRPRPRACARAGCASAAPDRRAVDDVRKHPGLVRSPIVGTAYLTPDPTARPMSPSADGEGGATLLIIEAMKVMNPITAPKAGTVARILIVNEQPVEYDEPLIVIE